MGSIHLSDQWDVRSSPEWSVGCVWFTRANHAEALGPRTDPAAGPTEAEGDGAGPEDAHSFRDGAPVLGRAPWLDPGSEVSARGHRSLHSTCGDRATRGNKWGQV